MPEYAHTHVHVCARLLCTHACTRTLERTRMRSHSHVRAHARPRTHTHTHTHTHTYTLTHTNRPCARTFSFIHTHPHTHMCTHSHAHACVRTRARACAIGCSHPEQTPILLRRQSRHPPYATAYVAWLQKNRTSTAYPPPVAARSRVPPSARLVAAPRSSASG